MIVTVGAADNAAEAPVKAVTLSPEAEVEAEVIPVATLITPVPAVAPVLNATVG